MFCSKCGMKLEDGAKFCQSCGTSVSQDNQVLHQSSPNTGSSIQSITTDNRMIRFICANAALVIIYFLGWLKLDGEIGDIFDFIGSGSKNSLSPSQFYTIFSNFKDSFLGSEMPAEYNIFYLLLVIPGGAALAIVLALLKKSGWAKLFTILSSIVTLLAVAGGFLIIAAEEYVGVKYGIFLAIAAAIFAFVASAGYKANKH